MIHLKCIITEIILIKINEITITAINKKTDLKLVVKSTGMVIGPERNGKCS